MPSASQVDAQADSLLERARESQAEQAALAETASLACDYSAALAVQLEAKQDQADRIEARLETLIALQTLRIQQTGDNKPGRLCLPGTKASWQQQVLKQQATLQRLLERLEEVREIRDGMGVHGPKLEELATRKLRANEPALAADWDDMQAAQRGHQALQRRRDQERRRQQSQQPSGHSLGLNLGRAP
jgi:hypothetical protein